MNSQALYLLNKSSAVNKFGYKVGIVILLTLICLGWLIINRGKRHGADQSDFKGTVVETPVATDTALDKKKVAEKTKEEVSAEKKNSRPASKERPTPTSKRHHLLFNFTAEGEGCLHALAKRSPDSWNSLGACCPYSITRSDEVARSGKYSIRYELHINDEDVANSKRAESARATDDESSLTERWYGISYYLPKDYVSDVCPELITQWQSLKGVSPPLALWTNNGIWQIVQFGKEHTDLGAYETGKWTDFVFHVKWSTGSDGLVEVWKQGNKVFSITNANSYPDYNTGNYMKNGIYKWGWKKGYPTNTEKRVLFIDDVRIGDESASYDDVAPGDD